MAVPGAPGGPPMPSEEQMKKAMEDMTHIAMALQPKPVNPNAQISIGTVLLACATSPCIGRTIPKDVPSKIDELEAAMVEQKVDLSWCDGASGRDRKHAIALAWQINRQRASLKEKDASLDPNTRQHASVVLQLATKLLVQAQMMFPHQRWVEATLAVARTSGLVANQLWSHEDLEAQVLMAKILKSEGLRRPKLRLEAVCEPKEVLPGGKVSAKVMLLRHHAGFDGEGEPPAAANPEGIYEAYWLYIAGLKTDTNVANSLLAAQPLVVKDLRENAVETTTTFTAPEEAGVYKLGVWVVSTSVIGVDLYFEASFTVAVDDVPALE